ncbi:uncharacterized protein N7503_009716 [Penicillium pulvis]|uniref:uncharacterized protein n=1 Tax=Penicillium pulvis TaxID=1562058 RepID=UPI002548E9A4|nr:uncharacterized protein N7503_009716 [Penicillium pulvis]KAJ5784504.1 hypothetical protein N7503_009716 [Penicillium pulvis]
MVRIMRRICAFQALLGLQHARNLVLGLQASDTDRVISVDVSDTIGRLKNLQGTNSADTGASLGNDDIHNRDPIIANVWSDYGIKHVLIYTWPEVFLGFEATGEAADPLNNANYNWTEADSWIHFVTSHGAKATIQYAGDILESSPETAGKIGFMITDRYMNGAHGSGFYDALELFDFDAEADLQNTLDVQSDYDSLFPLFAAFAHGVAKASDKAGVGAWGGNRIWTSYKNYSLYDPFVSRFYKDCKEQNVPLKAATFHFTNSQFSFDPYDVRRVTDNFREHVLKPAGFSDLPIWMTEYELNPPGIKPTQDSPIDQAFTWPGFGWGGSGAGNASFAPWFKKSANGSAIALNQAAAWSLQAQLISATPERVQVEGSSNDGFAVLAGRSTTPDVVQVLLNNYQPDYDMVSEITNAMLPFLNASTSAYPILQENGLFNGEQACLKSNNTRFIVAVCNTFPQAKVRDNRTKQYHLIIENLPWNESDDYEVFLHRVGGQNVSSIHTLQSGRELHVPIPVNAQDLITIKLSDSETRRAA